MKSCYFIYGEHEANPMPRKWSDNVLKFSRLNKSQFEARLVTLKTCRNAHADLFHYSKIFWAQVMRMKMILENGGLYSDCDIEWYGPVPDLDDCKAMFATEVHGHVSDAFFYAEKGNEIIEAAYEITKDWCYRVMNRGLSEIPTVEFLDQAGVGMFSKLVVRMSGKDFYNNEQVHMSEKQFCGKFHPEDGYGILPFEALCRRSPDNWVGWHQCNGTWRPRKDGCIDMSLDAKIQLNPH